MFIHIGESGVFLGVKNIDKTFYRVEMSPEV